MFGLRLQFGEAWILDFVFPENPWPTYLNFACIMQTHIRCFLSQMFLSILWKKIRFIDFFPIFFFKVLIVVVIFNIGSLIPQQKKNVKLSWKYNCNSLNWVKVTPTNFSSFYYLWIHIIFGANNYPIYF